MNRRIKTDRAPGAIGPYSQAIATPAQGEFLFVSGQIALDLQTGEMVQDDLQAEVTQVLKNLVGVIEGAGFLVEDVVKTTILLTDMSAFGAVNDLYGAVFGETLPARATFAVKNLPKNASVEIEAVCCRAPKL